jgi:hypothetical protein
MVCTLCPPTLIQPLQNKATAEVFRQYSTLQWGWWRGRKGFKTYLIGDKRDFGDICRFNIMLYLWERAFREKASPEI